MREVKSWELSTMEEVTGLKFFGLNTPRGRILKVIMSHMMFPWALLQIAKLHDAEGSDKTRKLVLKSCFKEIKNVTNHKEYDEMNDIRKGLDKIYEKHIKPVRDKLIAHHNLNTILEGIGFPVPSNEINDYHDSLKSLVELIEKHSGCKGDYQEYDYKEDTLDFIECLTVSN